MSVLQAVGEEEEEEDEEEEYQYVGRHDAEGAYHFPIVIEDLDTLAQTICEITGGTFNYNRGIGWIGIILSLMKEQDESIQFDFSQDDRYEELMRASESYKDQIIKANIETYKQSIFLKNHFLEKIDQMRRQC